MKITCINDYDSFIEILRPSIGVTSLEDIRTPDLTDLSYKSCTIIQTGLNLKMFSMKTLGSTIIRSEGPIIDYFLTNNPLMISEIGTDLLDKALDLDKESTMKFLIERGDKPSEKFLTLIENAIRYLNGKVLTKFINVLPDGYQRTRCIIAEKISVVKA